MYLIDAIDLKILRVLQKKGRISNSHLSDEVNLSPSACHRRVHRLEKEEIIEEYIAILNPRKINFPTTVFVEITLNGQAEEVLDKFETEVKKIPNILECHLMAGTADYLLKVAASDTDGYASLHRNFLTSLPGVSKMQSSFALKTVFKSKGLPV
tara:strand:- start:179 stop:640 length:462 start_codon:yes stop_codon:yes gene_type:complete